MISQYGRAQTRGTKSSHVVSHGINHVIYRLTPWNIELVFFSIIVLFSVFFLLLHRLFPVNSISDCNRLKHNFRIGDEFLNINSIT